MQPPNRRKRRLPDRIPRTRLRRGDLYAEIIEDRRCYPRVFHCIVQRDGSPEILSWGQFRTMEEAECAVEDAFNDLLPPVDARKRA